MGEQRTHNPLSFMEGLNYIETHHKTPTTHQITDDFRLKLRRLSLFSCEFEIQLSYEYTFHAFTKTVRKASIELSVHSLHSLRHAFALRERARTKDIY